MEINNYRKAITNTFNRVNESVQNQVPILDCMMNVKNMSDTDKIWYRAYKKYGNRAHTWQDFKKMFNSDIKTMRQTVKHWQTWKTINIQSSKQDSILTKANKLLLALPPEIGKNITTYEELRQFYPDLPEAPVFPDTNANYSVFHPELKKLERELAAKLVEISPSDTAARANLVTEYITKIDEFVDLRNADFVACERIENYCKIILKNKRILNLAKKFNTLSEKRKIDLARMFLIKSAIIHGTPEPQVFQDDGKDGKNELLAETNGGYHSGNQNFFLKGKNKFFSTLAGFFKILVHEDTHRIDHLNTDYGMLGPQLTNFSLKNYISYSIVGDDFYVKYSVEQSAFYFDSIAGKVLEYVINKQRS